MFEKKPAATKPWGRATPSNSGMPARCLKRANWRSSLFSQDQLRTLPATSKNAPSSLGVCRSRTLESRSEEHTSELQSLMRISYAVFCLKKNKHEHSHTTTTKV